MARRLSADSCVLKSFHFTGQHMDKQAFLHDFQQRIAELLKSSPAADIERNVKAMLAQGFQKMDLVTREEFDIQLALVERLRHRLDLLEARLDAPPADQSTSGH